MQNEHHQLVVLILDLCLGYKNFLTKVWQNLEDPCNVLESSKYE